MPCLHSQLRAAHAHRRWQNERRGHKHFWAQVLDLVKTLEDEEYSRPKKGHSILKTVKKQGENSDLTYEAQAEMPEMQRFAEGRALAAVNGGSHACAAQTCASFGFNSLVIVLWVSCMNKPCLLTVTKVTFCYLYKMLCTFPEDHLRI